ncbi:hypothetical protein GCM10010439_66520 [Actinocorallia aurantiaca]|uniref:Uncharacterized protein n=2 Tax=Actinocorallia aurantiaca TaxID=46204 RepID=A0ABN3UQE1_9ACTN
MSQWDSDLARARAERKAQEASFRQAAWMSEEQRQAASRQTYPHLQEAAAWAIARYREAGVPGQGRVGARCWPIGHVEVPIGPDHYGGYPDSRVTFLWADGKGGLFASEDKDGSSNSMRRLSSDDVGDFLSKDGNSLGVVQFVHELITDYEEWKTETGGKRFKVKVTFHPVRLVLFIAIFLVLAYFFS